MQNQTLLFPGFHLASLRRKPRTGRQELEARHRSIKQKSFDQLKHCFGKFIPKQCLTPEISGPLSRQRIYSKFNIFWAFMSQVLDADGGCREVVRKLQAQRISRSLDLPSASTAAYCKGRQKLNKTQLETIFEQTAKPSETQSAVPTVHGRRVVVVDGTGLSMPDTAPNQKIWPQQKNQKPGCGFPQASVCACFCLQSGLLLSYEVGNKKSHELPLLRAQEATFREGDIFLGDKGFTSYYDICRFKNIGVDSVIALSRKPAVTREDAVKILGEDDLLIEWKRPKHTLYSSYPKEGWLRTPETMILRQIKVSVQQPGFRVKSFYLITTLLDDKAYPAQILAGLYFQRWQVELFFRDIKTTLGMDILRCKSPEMIYKEILMYFIAYNCIRRLILEAALSKEGPKRQISFKGCLQVIRQFGLAFEQPRLNGKRKQEILDLFYEAIAQNVIPERPGRSEPRAVKRRPKPYRLMTAPRQEMIEIIRKEKHRKKPLS